MYCSVCGKEIPDGVKFCPVCGADVSIEGKVKKTTDAVFDAAEKEVGSAVKEVKSSIKNTEAPALQSEHLKDDRGLFSYILLSLITCGIYSYYFIYRMAHDVNIACEGDGEMTSGLVKYIVLSIITCGFYSLYWEYSLGNRLAGNAPRYGMVFQENGTSILLWHIFGLVLCGIGPFVAMSILIKNSNRICNAYNRKNSL